MSDGGRIRVGIDGARELEIEVDDLDGAARELERAITSGGVVWLTDTKGARHGVISGKIAFIEVEATEDRSIGFTH